MKPLVNDIDIPYCSFEVSKLLKTKGFDVFCKDVYTEYLQNTEYYEKGITFERDSFMKGRNSMNQGNEYWQIYPAPTHALAIEWLRINFNVEISTKTYSNHTVYGFVWDVKDEVNMIELVGFTSIYEATEAAIKYVLYKLT